MFQLFTTDNDNDGEVLNRDIYITEWFEDWNERIFLLESGELALGNYVHYTTCQKPVGKAKLIGRGVSHYSLTYKWAFDSIRGIKEFQVRREVDLKKGLLDMSYVLVNRNQNTGEYTFTRAMILGNCLTKRRKYADRLLASMEEVSILL